MPIARSNRRPPTENGVVLVTTLWVLIMLTTIATFVAANTQVEVASTQIQINQLRAQAIAEGAVWSQIFNAIQTSGLAQRSSSKELGTAIQVTIQSTDGLVDLNRAPPLLMRWLIASLTEDATTAKTMSDRIVDWRDRDSFAQLNGAEDDDYRQAGYAYECKDGPFNSVAELRYVLGMTDTLYSKLQPLVTVHNPSGSINILTAPERTLRAIPSLSEDIIGAILQFRESGVPLPDLGFEISQAGGTLSVNNHKSGAIIVEAIANVGKVSYTVESTVVLRDSAEQPFELLEWRANNIPERNLTR